jgi:hypothetical protein
VSLITYLQVFINQNISGLIQKNTFEAICPKTCANHEKIELNLVISELKYCAFLFQQTMERRKWNPPRQWITPRNGNSHWTPRSVAAETAIPFWLISRLRCWGGEIGRIREQHLLSPKKPHAVKFRHRAGDTGEKIM